MVTRKIIDANTRYIMKSLEGSASFENKRIRVKISKKEFKRSKIGENEISLNLGERLSMASGLQGKRGIYLLNVGELLYLKIFRQDWIAETISDELVI